MANNVYAAHLVKSSQKQKKKIEYCVGAVADISKLVLSCKHKIRRINGWQNKIYTQIQSHAYTRTIGWEREKLFRWFDKWHWISIFACNLKANAFQKKNVFSLFEILSFVIWILWSCCCHCITFIDWICFIFFAFRSPLLKYTNHVNVPRMRKTNYINQAFVFANRKKKKFCIAV